MRRLVFALLLAACGPDDPAPESVTVYNEDLGDKSDDVFGKMLRYVVDSEPELFLSGDRTWVLDVSVIEQSGDRMTVRADRTGFHVGPGERVSLSVEAWRLGQLTTRMGFLLFWNDGPSEPWLRGPWRLARCPKANYFDSVVVDADARTLDLTPFGEETRHHRFADCGVPDDNRAVAILPFPVSGWGSLVGDYRVVLRTRCEGPCDRD